MSSGFPEVPGQYIEGPLRDFSTLKNAISDLLSSLIVYLSTKTLWQESYIVVLTYLSKKKLFYLHENHMVHAY